MRHDFEFRGDTREYFGIWIVNVLLSIITLGIYGAWAKVRDKKYMYGNTYLDDHSFDYHATGKQILIGRLIVLGIFLCLGILNVIDPILYLIGILLLLCLVPFIVIRALRFNARVSSYRNVRFDFIGKLGAAIVTYILIPIGNLFTIYMCTPFVTRASQKFITNNAKYGDRDFAFSSKIGPYYIPFVIAIAIGFAGFIVLSVIMGTALVAFEGVFDSLAQAEQNTGQMDPPEVGSIYVFIMTLYALMILIFVPAVLLYKAWVRNIHFNNTVLDEQHQLQSDVNPGKYIWIVFSNALAALFTFGLMIPWGRIRLARYMASVTSLETEGSLDGYTSDVQQSAGFTAAEYADLEGFDIDIGI